MVLARLLEEERHSKNVFYLAGFMILIHCIYFWRKRRGGGEFWTSYTSLISFRTQECDPNIFSECGVIMEGKLTQSPLYIFECFFYVWCAYILNVAIQRHISIINTYNRFIITYIYIIDTCIHNMHACMHSCICAYLHRWMDGTVFLGDWLYGLGPK